MRNVLLYECVTADNISKMSWANKTTVEIQFEATTK